MNILPGIESKSSRFVAMIYSGLTPTSAEKFGLTDLLYIRTIVKIVCFVSPIQF